MKNWPDTRICDLLDIELPIIQAPMAGCDTPQLAAAVSQAGGLGSLACALLTPDQVRAAVTEIRSITSNPFNLNFFCHTMPAKPDEGGWKKSLQKYYTEFGLDIDQVKDSPLRAPFDQDFYDLMLEVKPAIISFHFGLPAQKHIDGLKSAGIKIMASATTLDEAKWLEARGCDAIIAQGKEAGGHRGMFLSEDLNTQIPTETLVQKISKSVSVPVIAAGGIVSAADIVTSFSWGASTAQLGTAYLLCPEAKISPLYKQALETMKGNTTAITNIFSGRPARGIENRFIREAGPISDNAPPFPFAARLVAPLRAQSEKNGSLDFMQMWAGEHPPVFKDIPAGELTKTLATQALDLF